MPLTALPILYPHSFVIPAYDSPSSVRPRCHHRTYACNGPACAPGATGHGCVHLGRSCVHLGRRCSARTRSRLTESSGASSHSGSGVGTGHDCTRRGSGFERIYTTTAACTHVASYWSDARGRVHQCPAPPASSERPLWTYVGMLNYNRNFVRFIQTMVLVGRKGMSTSVYSWTDPQCIRTANIRRFS